MRKFIIPIILLGGSLEINAQETSTEIKEVVVVKNVTQPTKKIDDKLYTGTEITKKGIDALGVVANSNIFNIVNIVPSVSVNTTDAYGLGQNVMRIRGVRSMFSGMTMEGIPNYGLSPIGAREDIYDKENLGSVSLYKGAVPADVFTGSGNRGGSIDLSFRRSGRETGLELMQSFGSNNYKRSFVRFDSGEFVSGEDTKTSFYTSFSYTDANKWKGFGKLATRKNFSLGITHHFNNHLKMELFTTYNHTFRNSFRPMNYKDVMNFDKSYNFDFNEHQTNIPEQDRFYFGYNSGNYENINSIMSIQYQPSEDHSFFLKPYYAKENAKYSLTAGNIKKPLKNDITRDFWQAGLVFSYRGRIQNLDYSLGYWYEASDNQGFTVNNSITNNGLVPRGKNIFIDVDGLGHLHNPYIKLAYNIGQFKVQAGLKYMAYRTPGSTRYLPSKQNSFVREEKPAEDLNTKTRLNDAFLPSVGVGFEANKNLEFYLNYGKGYMRQYSGVTNPYLDNRKAFLDANITLQSILDNWKTETSDNFDLGIIVDYDKVKINANVFYTKQNNVLSNVVDSRVNVNYNQNVGQQEGYGAELESYVYIAKGLSFFMNPSYTKFSYKENLNQKGKVLEIKGKQAPAVPVWMFKTGLMYDYKGLYANAFANYTGKRYGDATNKEEIPEFTLFDASFGYKHKFGKKSSVSFGAEVKNIFDKKYVGVITFGDQQLEGGTGYFVGFPRTFIASLKLDF
ncbi:MAG: TonB-dependent receptor [Flavobacteriaceae bacterium]|nr:TonB-dependent receptor [Flavobacteriaceae bacterium]